MFIGETGMGTAVAQERPVSAATERVVVLMTPADKRSLEEKAKAAAISVGEFVRRAVEVYDPAGEETEQIEAMLRHIEKMGQEILSGLDAATEQVRSTRAYLAERRSAA
jgi:hypothetical protein